VASSPAAVGCLQLLFLPVLGVCAVAVLDVDVAKCDDSLKEVPAHREQTGMVAAGVSGQQVQPAKACHKSLVHDHGSP
jgi:hypothetical protein